MRYRAGHFYLVALVQDDASQTSRILVSASQTGAGNGAWCNYFVDGTTGSGAALTWADFPQVGVTSNALYVGTTQYTFSGGSATGSRLTVIPTAPLDTCASATYRYYTGFVNSDASITYFISPATDYDAFGATAEYITGVYYPGASIMTVWRMTNPLSASAVFARFDVNSGAYDIPPGAPSRARSRRSTPATRACSTHSSATTSSGSRTTPVSQLATGRPWWPRTSSRSTRRPRPASRRPDRPTTTCSARNWRC